MLNCKIAGFDLGYDHVDHGQSNYNTGRKDITISTVLHDA